MSSSARRPNRPEPSAPRALKKPQRPAPPPATPPESASTETAAPASPQTTSSARVSPSPAPNTDADTTDAAERRQPIPPPSHPRQYRAIGLLRGRYQPSEESLTRGTLTIAPEDANNSEGEPVTIETVLLGRAIGVIKNYLDLEQPHLWVVYPRTRQREGDLHVQIVGVWEPETLKVDTSAAEGDGTPAEPLLPSDALEGGLFSVRGEVVFYSAEKAKVVVKIRQSPRQERDRPKFFKLELRGTLPRESAIGRFWDLQARLQGDDLAIQHADYIGLMPPKKKRKPASRPGPPSGSADDRKPKPKPVKRPESTATGE